MGNFSRDTYKINRDKNYVNVRSQMGIPLVDADLNEMDDIRKYEFQNFVRTFIGNGALGNDDFRIFGGYNGKNNFIIFPGYCLADGNVVYNDGDFRYSDQPFPYQDLADQRPLTQLSAPQNSTRIDTVYLDVWEREIDSKKDPNLVNPNIGIETCVRIKREWVVRVAEGIEGSGEAAIIPIDPEHCYYTLATLIRYPKDETISSKNIIDQRFVGINLRDSVARSVDLNRIYKVPLLQQTLSQRREIVAIDDPDFEGCSCVAFGGGLWVGSYNGYVSKINITNNEVKQTYQVGSNTSGIAIYKSIWVADNEENIVRKLDSQCSVLKTIPVGLNPSRIAFDWKNVWVANTGSGNVSKIDTDKDEKVLDIKVGLGPIDIAFDGTYIWVANFDSNSVSKIDTIKNEKLLDVKVGVNPIGIAFDGTHIWVANTGSGNVSKIDTIKNEKLLDVKVGLGDVTDYPFIPSSIAFDGTHIWVGSNTSSSFCYVSKIDITNNSVLIEFHVIDGIINKIAFDGTHMWVSEYMNKLVKIEK